MVRLAAGRADIGGGFRRRLAVDVQRDHLRLAAEPERDGAANPEPAPVIAAMVLQQSGHVRALLWRVSRRSGRRFAEKDTRK